MNRRKSGINTQYYLGPKQSTVFLVNPKTPYVELRRTKNGINTMYWLARRPTIFFRDARYRLELLIVYLINQAGMIIL